MTRVVEEQERKGWGEMSVGRAPNTVWELDTAEWFPEELFRKGGTWSVSWGFLRVKTFPPGGTAFTKTQRQEEAQCSGELVWVGVEHGYGYRRKKWSKVHRGPAVLVSGIYSLSPVRCGASESYLPGPDVISFACGLAESCGPHAHAWRILLYQMLLNPENSDDELKS